MHDLLARPRPSIFELILVFIFAFSITFAYSIYDVNIHDTYVLPDIVANYGSPNQLAVGDLYWETLNGLFLFFAGILFIIRLILGKLAGAKWSTMLFFLAFMWGFSAVALFYFGWLDTFYYEVKGEDIPQTLQWLDQSGLFVYVKQFGPTESVDKSDLYLLNALGVILLAGIWFKLMYLHSKKHLHRIGIHH